MMPPHRQEWRVIRNVLGPVLLCLLCSLMAARAVAGPVLLLSENFSYQPVGEYVEALEDPDLNLSLKDLLNPAFQGRFTPANHDILHLGVSRSAWWLRLSVHNPDAVPRDLILDLHSASLGSIRLYEPTADGEFRLHEAGSRTQRVRGDLPAAGYWFKLQAPAARTSTYYLRLQTELDISTAIYLGTPADTAAAASREGTLFGIGIGIIFGLALYNLMLLYGTHRDRSGLLYVLFLLSISCLLYTSPSPRD